MSRIGKLPVTLPAGVTAELSDGNVLKVKGPKGELTQQFSGDMEIKIDAGVITVTRPSDDKKHRALPGRTRRVRKRTGNHRCRLQSCALRKEAHA